MALTCNIDARGKRARLLIGITLLTLAGVLTLTLGLYGHGRWRWAVIAVVFASAAFVIFEARAGWCAIRAMGFKTRI